MWPFKKKSNVATHAPQRIGFSQVDSTEHFYDDERLGVDDWIGSFALNTRIPEPTAMGLPLPGASDDEAYKIAAHLSAARDLINLQRDGVYCPVCHISNKSLSRLKAPCPKCSRPLLRFGWD